jgi:hypothetical protein
MDDLRLERPADIRNFCNGYLTSLPSRSSFYFYLIENMGRETWLKSEPKLSYGAKTSVLIPLALDIERCGGERDQDGVGMAPVARVLP